MTGYATGEPLCGHAPVRRAATGRRPGWTDGSLPRHFRLGLRWVRPTKSVARNQQRIHSDVPPLVREGGKVVLGDPSQDPQRAAAAFHLDQRRYTRSERTP